MNFDIVKLRKDWEIKFPIILEGGGVEQRVFFAKKVQATGKNYKRAFEWCAGMGIIGYDLLSKGYCDHIVFNDKFPLAIDTCLENAKNNNITTLVTGYIGDSISTIPKSEKWDLVVANPPHTASREGWERAARESFAANNAEPWEPELFDNWARLIVDEDWKSHVDFFKHLKDYLLPDADVFICENGKFDFLEKLFQEDFNIILTAAFPILGHNALMYHLKAK